MTELMLVFTAVLPSSNKCPTFRQSKTMMVDLGLVPRTRRVVSNCFTVAVSERYDVCPNDCVLFMGSHADATHCPQCNAQRKTSDGKPAKEFIYFPLIPQLQRMYSDPVTAERLRWAGEHKFDPDVVADISESRAFRDFVLKDDFFHDIRNIALTVCADGVNPWTGSNYSMWPILSCMLNLPPHLRTRPEYMLLLGLVPGSKAPKNINTYLRLVVDELLMHGLHGVDTYDAFRDEDFTMSVRLALLIADYPGMAKVLCMKGSGAICGCMKCTIRGVRIQTGTGETTAYTGWRRFLPADHPFRRDVDTFGSEELEPAPAIRDHSEVLQHATAAREAFARGVKPGSTADPSKATAVTNFSELLRLPYWNHILNSPVEIMHIIVSHVIEFLLLYLAGRHLQTLHQPVQGQSLCGRLGRRS